ncbi:MAG: hypothetical protein E6X17_10830 [Sporomusaceae bacterium]|nr:hypothetical protein [Sporomusaceae bacterium]
MMKLIETVPADGRITIRVPKEMGRRVQIIIRNLPGHVEEKPVDYMKLQENSGFVRKVLAAPEEDVWNDL